jgi:hypothetical protein
VRKPNARNWAAEKSTEPMITAPTPAATAFLLVQADSYPVDAATMPYCGCGRLFDGQTSIAMSSTRNIGQMVGAGAVHARAAVSRCWSGYTMAGATGLAQGTTVTGGTTAGLEVRISHSNPVYEYAPLLFGHGITWVGIDESSSAINDTPSGAYPTPRQFELATNAIPYVEPMTCSNVAGFTVVVAERIGDLELL